MAGVGVATVEDMPMTHYRRMRPERAEAVLEEFLAERAPALQRLRDELTVHGMDPQVMLDGTPGSLTPLWAWITDRRTELAAAPGGDTAVPPRFTWPSWARHTVTSMKVPSATMFVLLDGLVSYLAQVLITGAPTALWAVGSPEDPDHHLHHHPVLTGAGQQIFVPTLPLAGMLRLKRGEKSLGATELADYATTTITSLAEATPYLALVADLPVVVVAAPQAFDVGVRTDIAAEHPHLVEQMVAELTTQHGISTVEWAGYDAFEVHTPSWEAEDLQLWLSAWLKIRLPFDR